MDIFQYLAYLKVVSFCVVMFVVDCQQIIYCCTQSFKLITTTVKGI